MFESGWDELATIMDEAVDDLLGLRVRYRHGGIWLGEGDPPVIPAFTVLDVENIGLGEMDGVLGSRTRLKVARRLVDEPSHTDRIAHPKLGQGAFRPANWLPDTDARYWIIELQETVT